MHQPFLFDGIQHPVFIQETELSSLISPAEWLFSHSLYPKVYLKDKGTQITRAAAGATLQFSHPPCIQGKKEIRIYGGQRFSNSKKESSWSSFPESAYWLPFSELSYDGNKATFRHYSNELPFTDISSLNHHPFQPSHTSYTPTYKEWEKSIEKALHLIQTREIDKVVLARKTSLFFDTAPSPFTLISQLEKESPSGTLFFFQFEPGSAFLGVSPERLYSRSENVLAIEAIAGTRTDPDCFSCKETREFTLVKEAVEQLLAPFSTFLRWQKQDSLIKAGPLYHLYNQLTAHLDPYPTDREILALLHPTPALGGYPKVRSCDLIDELEPFDRGWYGAPIGMVSQQKSSFSVAIRSALFHDHQIDLFTGAGIVEGSSPQKEWEELNTKLQWFLRGAL